MKAQEITEEMIRQLVDNFYAKVRADSSLGIIFTRAIGEGDAWKPHLQQMYAFWSSVMLARGSYFGNPVQKHRRLPFFESSHFDTWLALFEETARELYVEEMANRFVDRSRRIAQNLKFALYAE